MNKLYARTRTLFVTWRFGWMQALILSPGLSSCTVVSKPASLEGKPISSIVIRHSLPDRANHSWDHRLRGYMKLREGIPYSSELVDDAIRSLYESGYVDDVRIIAETGEQSIRLIAEIEDSRPFGPSLFIGNAAFSDPKLGLVIKSNLKSPITEAQVDAAREKLEQFYLRQGYKQVRITIDYEHWGKQSVQDFVLIIKEGPRTPPWYEALYRSPGNTIAPRSPRD